MNKKLILLVALLCLGSSLFAQNHEDQWIWPDDNTTDELMILMDASPVIGGGLAFATAPTTYPAAFEKGLYYQIGIGANGRLAYRMSPEPHGISRLGLGVEVLLSKTNIKADSDTFGALRLAFPVLIHFYMTSDLVLETGATFVKSLKTNPEELQDGSVWVSSGNIEYNDVMLSVGAFYKTPFNLALGLRYNHSNSVMSETLDSKISNLVFTVSYKFPVVK